MSEQLKSKLQTGKSCFIINADHPHPSLVQFLGSLPVDAVFIDCEQGSADVETVENLARAAYVGGVASLVRLFSPEDWVIERYLGRGVDGIVVPRVDTSEQAAHVVEAVQYCLPHSFDSKLVIIQIETRNAYETLDEFLRVDGIDVYFIGPVDLAKSLGYAGDYRHPTVVKAIDEAIEKIHSAGKTAGILVTDNDVNAYHARGVRFLYAHVNDFLRIGADYFALQISDD